MTRSRGPNGLRAPEMRDAIAARSAVGAPPHGSTWPRRTASACQASSAPPRRRDRRPYPVTPKGQYGRRRSALRLVAPPLHPGGSLNDVRSVIPRSCFDRSTGRAVAALTMAADAERRAARQTRSHRPMVGRRGAVAPCRPRGDRRCSCCSQQRFPRRTGHVRAAPTGSSPCCAWPRRPARGDRRGPGHNRVHQVTRRGGVRRRLAPGHAGSSGSGWVHSQGTHAR